MSLLDACSLGFTYHGFPSFRIRDISLSFEPGTLAGLLGPNGSGKSTLLKLLAGLLRPAGGEVRLEGLPLARTSGFRKGRLLAFVPQSVRLAFPFTALDLVRMGRFPHVGRFRTLGTHDRAVCDEALRLCDASRFRDRRVDELSGGEKQRVFLASALAQEPRVLLLDEPASNLDPSHQEGLFEILSRLVRKRRLCVVCALHDLNLAARRLPRTVLLKDGAVLADGHPSRVLKPSALRKLYGISFTRVPLKGRAFLVVPRKEASR